MDVADLVPNLDISLFGYFFIQLHLGFCSFFDGQNNCFFPLDFYVRKRGTVGYSQPFLKQGDTFKTFYM